jgi:anti-sigma factor RsiW
LVYSHNKHVINVWVWANDGSDSEAEENYSRQGYNLVHFTEDDLDYWAVSDLNRADLDDFVNRLETAARTPAA